MKTKKRTYEQGFRTGVICAADIAADYDSMSSHKSLVSDCILGKLNQTRRRNPRKNPHHEKQWILGFTLALAEVQRAAGCGSATASVLRDAGLTVKKLKSIGVEAYDIEPIARAVRAEGKRR